MPTDQINLLQVANGLGTLGVLIFLVLAFYRGDIVAKPVLDRIVKTYDDRIAELVGRFISSLDRLDARMDATAQEHAVMLHEVKKEKGL